MSQLPNQPAPASLPVDEDCLNHTDSVKRELLSLLPTEILDRILIRVIQESYEHLATTGPPSGTDLPSSLVAQASTAGQTQAGAQHNLPTVVFRTTSDFAMRLKSGVRDLFAHTLAINATLCENQAAIDTLNNAARETYALVEMMEGILEEQASLVITINQQKTDMTEAMRHVGNAARQLDIATTMLANLALQPSD
ncbi:hypothetical protein ACHAQA_008036 [Verticillium albo-atrum]